MLLLINFNTMVPAIGPIGLDYVGGAACEAGIEVEVIDLCLEDDGGQALGSFLAERRPRLIGISLRNVDDCFWPNGQWFVSDLEAFIGELRGISDAPIVLGGVGFSIFAERIMQHTGVDFGIAGDGEQGIIDLFNELGGGGRFERVGGLLWREKGVLRRNRPAWPGSISVPTRRDVIDNRAYFQKGGQCGLETKRGCNRGCIYCADALAKGNVPRVREPAEVADEAESLLAQGIDVLHLCDAEFNVPVAHALAVCAEFNRRGLGKRLRWYTYMAATPFDGELAEAMGRAGCVGINFTADSACPAMLRTYRQGHGPGDLASAVNLCRANGIKVMFDLLVGGPGETGETVAETIAYMKRIEPDAVGAALGIRVYPGTAMAEVVAQEGPLERNRHLHRKYGGPIDFFKPTFYISDLLGERPAELIGELVGDDARFFVPQNDVVAVGGQGGNSGDHNYNANIELVRAIENGARGAYWDILRQLRDA